MTDNFSKFKPIRNKIRKYQAMPLFSLCLNQHKEVEASPRNMQMLRTWTPWDLLLLLRWIAAYGDFEGRGQQREPTTADLGKLFNQVKSLTDRPDLLPSEFGIERFMRAMAFQQFWWQRPLDAADLGRLWLLFGELAEDHEIVRQFREISGITPSRFLELAFLLWTYHHNKGQEVYFGDDIVRGLHIPQDEWQAFLSLLAVEPARAGEEYEAHSRRIRDPYHQHLDRPPFVRHPLLDLGNRYTLVSRRVFDESTRVFIYDTLRERHASDFAQRFGPVFEGHLEHGLRHLNAPFLREKAQTKALGPQSVVDYLVPLESATVMIEAKATELNPIARALGSPKRMASELRDSAVKGVIQGFAVADGLRKNADMLEIPNRAEFLHLVVTYQPLYLWHGGRAWDEFIGAAVTDKLQKRGIDASALLPSSIFFISVAEYDLLIQAAQGDADVIAEILLDAREKNGAEDARKGLGGAPAPTARFSLEMHLRERLDGTEAPRYLTDAVERLMANIEGFFEKDQRL